jgi:hypothetical protein
MSANKTLVDIFLDDPGLKFIDCYHKMPVFRKLIKTGETGRFWYAFSIGADRIIVLGPKATRLDLCQSIAFIESHSLKNHLIAGKNGTAAAAIDFQYLKMIDGVVKIVMPEGIIES